MTRSKYLIFGLALVLLGVVPNAAMAVDEPGGAVAPRR